MPIEVCHLTHCYSEGSAFRTVALDDVSFRVDDGEFIGVIGHTGSGKSTLVQHLNGLLRPSSGQVLIDGEDLNGEHVNRRALRQRIGLVFQYPEYQLFEETVAKDIAFGPKNQGLSADEIAERVRYAMDCVHLDYEKYAERSPFELSGGQKQRVAIAGILAMEPSVIIADEATAMLDPSGRKEVLETIRTLNRQKGITVVWITHFMEEAALADRVIVVTDGQIRLSGTPAEVFDRVDEMREMHLDVPHMTALAGELRAAGMPLKPGILTVEELVEEVERLCPLKSST